MATERLQEFEHNLDIALNRGPINQRITDLYKVALPEFRSRVSLIEDLEPLPQSQAELMLSSLSDEQVQDGFAHLMGRLKNETDYLRELEEVGVDKILLGQRSKFALPFVTFANHESWGSKFFAKIVRNDAVGGKLWPLTYLNWVSVFDDQPSPRVSWEKLVSQGKLPYSVEVLYHELIHDLQYQPVIKNLTLFTFLISGGAALSLQTESSSVAFNLSSLAFIANFYGEKLFVGGSIRGPKYGLLLAEVQAYGATENSSATFPLYEGSYVQGTEEKYFFETVEAAGKIHVSCNALRSFGYSEREIAQLVRKHARFNRHTDSFPRLDNLVVNEAEKWGAEDASSMERVIKLLDSKRRLELRLNRMEAAKIAIEELQRISS